MTYRYAICFVLPPLLFSCSSGTGSGGTLPDGGLGGAGGTTSNGGAGKGGQGSGGSAGHAGDAGGSAGGPGCAEGKTSCGSTCVDLASDPLHCGTCPNACPSGGVCDNGTCVVIEDCTTTPCSGLSYCDLGTKKCLPGCLSAAQCGANEGCDAATHTCQCNPGFHDCGGACAPDDSPASCGSSCSPCPSDANGTATCVAGQCGVSCNSGYHLCESGCASSSSPASCGSNCSSCPADPNGTATCIAGACGIDCNTGYLACGGLCASCPTDGVNTTDCSGSQCVVKTCKANYWKCSTGCCTFTSELVDSAADYGDDVDIAVDSQGGPHLAYERADGVVYAKKDGSSWNKIVIDPFGYRTASIALVGGQPWVAYQSYQNSKFSVRVGRWSGSAFTINDVTDPGCCSGFTAIAAVGTGAQVAYQGDYTNNGGHVASVTWTGTSWKVNASHGYFASWRTGGIAGDSSGVAHLVYPDQYSGVRELTWNGTQYVATTVASGTVGVDAKIAIRGSSRGVVYCSSNGLYYARSTGTTWTTELVEAGNITGCDVDIDVTGRAHVSFVDSGKVRYASLQSGIGWTFIDLASGSSTAISLDPSGNPRIVYANSSKQLYYAH